MIELLKITVVNKGSLLGFCDLSIPQLGMDIFSIAIFQIRFKKKESMENFSNQVFQAINPEIEKALAVHQSGPKSNT